MSIDISDRATAVEEFAVGAAEAVVQVASDPIGSVRKQARTFERKGTPAVRRINRRLNALIPDRVVILGVEVDQRFPEKLAIKGLHAVRGQSRRRDVVGEVAKRTLRMFNGSFRTIARTATRLEAASDTMPQRRETERKPARRRSTRSSRRRAA